MWAPILMALAAGCSAAGHSGKAERSARRLLAERHEAALGQREETALRPAEQAEEEAPEKAEEEPAGIAPQVLDLRTALAIAFASSRVMLARLEALEARALSLGSVRHGFAPQLAASLSLLFAETRGGSDAGSGALGLSASQILPTGAVLSIDGTTRGSTEEGASAEYDSLVSVRLAQPLLRGSGHAVSHEPLVQAERDLIYTLRDFELFREDFSIEVARQFYGLVNRKQAIQNQIRNLESNVFGLRRAEALFAVGIAKELDVLRARRSELTARNALLEAEEGLQLALEQFRIFLGLPDTEPVDVAPDPPPFTPVTFELGSAVAVALENRLDLLTRREQLEDVERAVLLTRDRLLPDLDLRLGADFASESADSLGGSDPQRTGASVSVALGIPVDRVRERNAYRASQLGLARARRDLDQFQDDLKVRIRSSFRELSRRLQSLEIQRQIIEDQTRNLRIAELRFEQGQIENRDVVEANQSLLDAQNALIDEQVNYEIARLQLLRELGILFIDESGMWKR